MCAGFKKVFGQVKRGIVKVHGLQARASGVLTTTGVKNFRFSPGLLTYKNF